MCAHTTCRHIYVCTRCVIRMFKAAHMGVTNECTALTFSPPKAFLFIFFMDGCECGEKCFEISRQYTNSRQSVCVYH